MFFSFEYPLVFLTFLFVAVFFIVYISRVKKQKNFSQGKLLLQIYRNNSIYFSLLICSMLISFICIWGLLAWPYQSYELQETRQKGRDIVVILDLSYSMLAQDMSPNRLETAKRVLQEFFVELSQDRVWLVLFAGKAFQSIPLVSDIWFLEEFMSRLEVDIIPQEGLRFQKFQGTAIWDALLLGSDMFWENQRKKIMILLSDGSANTWVDPLIAGKLLQEKSIILYTVGLWQPWESSVYLPHSLWLMQRIMVEWVDSETLWTLAEMTWWQYFWAEDEKMLREVFREISELEKHLLEVDIVVEKNSLEKFFMILFILSILFQLLLLWRKKIMTL